MKSPEESIGLTSATLFTDDPTSHSSSYISSSEPLLEDNPRSTNHSRRSKWNAIYSSITALLKRSRRQTEIGEKIRPGKRKGLRLFLRIGLGVLLILGVIQFLSLIASLVTRISPNGVHRLVKFWGHPGRVGADLASWPTDFTRDIRPIPCHSHNDYWRTVPLYSAIEVGCVGVEADIWLFNEQLYVGHSVASLTPNRTINSLYIDPLLDILAKQNPTPGLILEEDTFMHGVFDTTPEQSLVFLIDFKTAGATLWPYVQSALEPLRKRHLLTRSNGTTVIPGPITVVGTGNTPFDLVISDESNPHHDVFFDAPLSDMYQVDGSITEKSVPPRTPKRKRSDKEGQGKSGIAEDNPDVFNPSNSYYASVPFGEAIGKLQNGRFSQHQMDLLRGQIRGAHQRGLKARYWDLPFWPINLRDYVWDVLVKEGVDMLNVDDLKGVSKQDWDKRHGWGTG